MIDGVRAAYAEGYRRVLLQAPTGSGKTVVFSDIARNTSNNNKRVEILAHRVELLEQCGEKMQTNGVNFGYINPKFTPNHFAKVQVGTMQTVARRLHKTSFVPDLLIIDECHRVMGQTYRSIINHYKHARVLGVTATPIRLDGQPLGDLFEKMILGPTVQELITLGSLVRPITYAPIEQLDLSGIKTIGGDFDGRELSNRMDMPDITGNAVEHYRKICPGVPAVAFCVNVKHAKHVAEEFKAAGFTAEHIDGTMTNSERKRILRGLANGIIQVVTSVDLITEGFDAPMIQCAIILRPTQSVGLYIQMGGRPLRPYPGKQVCYVLDHAGCAITHGLITEDREWSLSGVVKKKRGGGGFVHRERMQQCPKCFAVTPVLPYCPECHYVYENVSMPSVGDGELKEVTKEIALIMRMQRAKEVEEADSLEALINIQNKRNYKAGWAKATWAARNVKLGMV